LPQSKQTTKRSSRPANVVTWPVRPPVDAIDSYRISNYQRYWQLYLGVQFPGTPNGRDKRIVLNFLAAAAQKMAGYVMSPAPDYVIGEAGAEASWADTVEANRLATLDYHAALWAAVVGDAAYRLGWDADRGRVSITSADPSQLWARTKADDKRVIEWVAQRYFLQTSYNNEPGNIPDPMPLSLGGAQYNSYGAANTEVIEEWTADLYRLWMAGKLEQEKPNPYGFIPYIIVPNSPKPGQYWGTSDFADLWPLALEMNLATSTFATIVEYSGAPVVVVEAANTDNLRVGPGQMWDLPAASKAYLLDMMNGGGTKTYLDYLNHLSTVFRELAALPSVAWGDVEAGTGINARSGAALALQLNPLLQAVARRRLIWEDAFIDRCRMAWAVEARMTGAPDYKDVDISLTWSDLLMQQTQEGGKNAATAAIDLTSNIT
jgi:Phage portal protein, SPP1 Gp6-like